LKQLELKKIVLREHTDTVWVSKDSPNTEKAKREVLDMLVSYLPIHYPHIYKMDGQYICNYATGDSWKVIGDALDQDPLEIASLLIQEDLVILEPEGDNLIVTAGCVCFPSKWNIKEKFLQNLPVVHDPVPPFEEQLANPVMRALRDLNPTNPIYRVNWSIMDDLKGKFDLFLPSGRLKQEPGVTDVDQVGEKMMYRIERQTLKRLPKSNGILFTIRTIQRPLKEVVEYSRNTNKDIIVKLVDAIKNMEPSMKPYKSGHFWMDICCEYLTKQLDSS